MTDEETEELFNRLERAVNEPPPAEPARDAGRLLARLALVVAAVVAGLLALAFMGE